MTTQSASYDDVSIDEPGISASRILHVLRSYRAAIVLSLLAIAVACAIVSIATYLVARQERVTTQTFRLDFEGAAEGRYPSATKFSPADIVNGPTLLRAYKENHLAEYLAFNEFSRSIFVLESNKQYDDLAVEYQVRLADPKLTAVDRDRIQQEFEQKRQSIAKNDYALSFTRQVRGRTVPELVARKVLLDILADWADFAVNQQHAMEYQLSVLSPQVLRPSPLEQSEIVIATQVLRSKINKVISNVAAVRALPGATLVRTSGGVSLEETVLRLDEIIRFQLDPLMSVALNSPIIADRAATIRFLEVQLAYDQRQLEATQRSAQATRDALAIYEQPAAQGQPASSAAGEMKRKDESKVAGSTNESVMPQLSDTFLDRLMTLTARGSDVLFRQKLINDYRNAVAATIPLQQAVSYDTDILKQVKAATSGASAVDPVAVRQQIEAARADAATLTSTMNELFKVISRNLSPSTQLFTVMAPPTSSTVSAYSLSRLLLYSLLVLLISIPVVVALCFLHNRVREDEELEGGSPTVPAGNS